VALGAGAIFKLSAFAREAFIAAKFGLSAVTDAYFGLQQLPLIVATFMLGAFALAFTPAYAEARRNSGTVEWLPGLLFYGCLIGSAFTVLTLAAAPLLLRTIRSTGTGGAWTTLAILSLSYVPIIAIGIWSGVCTARGHNLWAMTVSGLPYLLMTLVLFGLYAAGRLSSLSLPVSMTSGFAIIGIGSLILTFCSQPAPARMDSVLSVWKFPEFRRFLRQLGASSFENCGFAANQLLMLYFLSRIGTGVLSANNCAMRIGMLGYSLLSPLAQLVQARLCTAEESARAAGFRSALLTVGGIVFAFASVILVLRVPVIRLAYMHGKFQGSELNLVAKIVPAWIGYFVVMSLNAIVARYLFIRLQGSIYVRRQMYAYMAANLFRFVGVGFFGGAAWIIWCSVAAESFALLFNLRTCFAEVNEPQMIPALTPTSEVS
jgi:peptidoglycan biosynthesis protein MviN/MurJ (putative lipid II flippase)